MAPWPRKVSYLGAVVFSERKKYSEALKMSQRGFVLLLALVAAGCAAFGLYVLANDALGLPREFYLHRFRSVQRPFGRSVFFCMVHDAGTR